MACTALGAYCNEVVRAANAGHMPVEGYHRMLEGFGAPANTYAAAGPAHQSGLLQPLGAKCDLMA